MHITAKLHGLQAKIALIYIRTSNEQREINREHENKYASSIFDYSQCDKYLFYCLITYNYIKFACAVTLILEKVCTI